MKRLREGAALFGSVLCLLLWPPPEAHARTLTQTGLLRTRANRNGVEGNTTRSFLNQGLQWNSEVNYTARWSGNLFNYDFSFAGRGATDTQIDRHRPPHLLNALLGFADDTKNLRGQVGEFTANFTPYTFLSSVEGMSLLVKTPADTGFWNFAAGRTRQAEDNVRFDRYAVGARRVRQLGPWTVGASFAHADDEDKSAIEGFRANLADAAGEVYGFDIKRSFLRNAVGWEMEFANSSAKDNLRRTEDVRLAGTAWRSRLTNNQATHRESLLFERVSPLFRTFTGFASSDLLQFRLEEEYRFSPSMRLLSTYHFQRDNIERTKTTTTTSRTPDVSYTWNPFPDSEKSIFKMLGFDLGWNRRATVADNRTTDRTATTYRAGMTTVWKDVRFFLSHVKRTTVEAALPTPQPNTVDRTTTFSALGNGDWRDMPYRWNGRYSYQRIETVRGAGQYDRTFTLHLEGQIDPIAKLSLLGSFDWTDAQRQVRRTDSARLSYRAEAKYNQDARRSYSLSYRIDFNRNDDVGLEFVERVIAGEMNVRF